MAVTTDLGPCSRSVIFNLPSAKPDDILSIYIYQCFIFLIKQFSLSTCVIHMLEIEDMNRINNSVKMKFLYM